MISTNLSRLTIKSLLIVISFAFCLTVLPKGLKTETLKKDYQILADMEAVLDRRKIFLAYS
jgi:hypothetical protein